MSDHPRIILATGCLSYQQRMASCFCHQWRQFQPIRRLALGLTNQRVCAVKKSNYGLGESLAPWSPGSGSVLLNAEKINPFIEELW